MSEQNHAKELMDRAIERTSEKRAEFIESYIVTYLKANPQYTINDLTVVEETKGTKIIWYLAPKSVVGATH